MYKDKNGKVFASLTEVKNKTGDVFSLVDENGKVHVTSYNKVKYIIFKNDVKNFVDLKEDREDGDLKRDNVTSSNNEIGGLLTGSSPLNGTLDLSRSKSPNIEEGNYKLMSGSSSSVLNALSGLVVWDRNNGSEIDYIQHIIKPLQ